MTLTLPMIVTNHPPVLSGSSVIMGPDPKFPTPLTAVFAYCLPSLPTNTATGGYTAIGAKYVVLVALSSDRFTYLCGLLADASQYVELSVTLDDAPATTLSAFNFFGQSFIVQKLLSLSTETEEIVKQTKQYLHEHLPPNLGEELAAIRRAIETLLAHHASGGGSGGGSGGRSDIHALKPTTPVKQAVGGKLGDGE